MFHVYIATAHSKSTIREFATFELGLAYLVERAGSAEFVEVDPDHSECADAFADGDVISLEPVGFSLAA